MRGKFGPVNKIFSPAAVNACRLEAVEYEGFLKGGNDPETFSKIRDVSKVVCHRKEPGEKPPAAS